MKQLKRFGVAGFLALALALGGSVASASAETGFVAGEYPAKVSGASEYIEFQLGNNTLTCSPSLELEMAEDTTQPETASFTGGTCFWAGLGNMTLEANGCQLSFDPHGESESATFEGEFSLGGAECEAMTISHSFWNCELQIEPTSEMSATFENQGSGSGRTLRFNPEASTLRYTGVGGYSNCPEGTHSDGEMSGGLTMSAESGGEQAALYIGDVPGRGVFVEGGEFQAEQYPMPMAGEATEPHEFTLGPVGEVACPSAGIGTNLGAAGTTLSPVGAGYEDGCLTSGTWQTSVEMNSCYYVFHIDNTMDIVCENAEDAIDVTLYKVGSEEVKCHAHIGPQTGLSEVTYSTEGSEENRAIQVNVNVANLSYETTDGFFKCGVSKGTHTNGTFTGGNLLKWWGYL